MSTPSPTLIRVLRCVPPRVVDGDQVGVEYAHTVADALLAGQAGVRASAIEEEYRPRRLFQRRPDTVHHVLVGIGVPEEQELDLYAWSDRVQDALRSAAWTVIPVTAPYRRPSAALDSVIAQLSQTVQ